MNLDREGLSARGLRRYVALVADAMGVGAEASYAQFEPPVDAYLALEDRLGEFPERDVALLWDELHGWALAVETHGGADLVVLGYLGLDVLPSPRMVAEYVKRAIDGEGVGEVDPPIFRSTDAPDELSQRLACYAQPG